jgi:hypothetical protein
LIVTPVIFYWLRLYELKREIRNTDAESEVG